MSLVYFSKTREQILDAEIVDEKPKGSIAKRRPRYTTTKRQSRKPEKIRLLNRKGVAVDTIEADVWMNGSNVNQSSEELMPVYSPLPSEMWNTARKNPKGRFVTYHMSREAFRNPWKYTEPDAKDDESLDKELDTKLQNLRKKFKIQQNHIEAVWLARAIGRSILMKFPKRPITQPLGEWYFRVAHITDYNIIYDSDGIVESYEPWIKIGRDIMPYPIKADRCELYVNNKNPLGNGYEGISELEASYYPMLWMSDILESWAEIMAKRGLGILDITIEGATQPELDKLKQENGDPSQYTVIFHDEKWKVAAPATVSAQYNLDTMVSVYTKEVSSANAVGKARVSGDLMGAVTGSKSDQDNFGQTLGSIQNDFHQNLLNVHVLADPSLKDKFGVAYDLSVRADRAEALNNFSTAATAVNQTLGMLSYNQVLAKLGLPTVKDGDMLASYWMATHQDFDKKISLEAGVIPVPGDVGNQNPSNMEEEAPDEKKVQKKEEYKDREKKRLNGRNETEITKDRDSLSRSELKKLKVGFAKKIMLESDSYPISYSDVNSQLKGKFGSGLSNTDLCHLREQL